MCGRKEDTTERALTCRHIAEHMWAMGRRWRREVRCASRVHAVCSAAARTRQDLCSCSLLHDHDPDPASAESEKDGSSALSLRLTRGQELLLWPSRRMSRDSCHDPVHDLCPTSSWVPVRGKRGHRCRPASADGHQVGPVCSTRGCR